MFSIRNDMEHIHSPVSIKILKSGQLEHNANSTSKLHIRMHQKPVPDKQPLQQ